MPDHWTHTKINLIAAPLVTVAAYNVTHDLKLSLVVLGAHVVSTVYLSPDLDLVNSSPEHVWGPLRWIWYPYGKVIHHRSILSHGGPLSALLRVAYLTLAVETIMAVAAFMAVGGFDLARFVALNSTVGHWIEYHRSLVLALMAGVVTSDAVHTISDHISTAIKVARHGGRNHWRELAKHHR